MNTGEGIRLSTHNDDVIPTVIFERVNEVTYTNQNPKVLEQTEVFYKRANVPEIFSGIGKTIISYPSLAQKIVGSAWHEFSDIMPWVLCTLASKVNTNLVRHYIIQGAFEELGGRNCNDIHPDQFLSALNVAGIRDVDIKNYQEKYSNRKAIGRLVDNVKSLTETSEVLGFGLGLEIPAVENIETVFSALTPSLELKEKVAETPFFKIHRVIEEEHIRLHTSNFLRFCSSDVEKEQFYKGFDLAIRFWMIFWSEAALLTKEEALSSQPSMA